MPLTFLVPFLALSGLFLLYPVISATLLTAHRTFGPRSSVYVGWQNFRDLANDTLFAKALFNTALYTLLATCTQVLLALTLALLLNREGLRGRSFFRLIFFAPSTIGLVYAAVLFSPVFEKHYGLINVALHRTIGFDLEFPWAEQHVMLTLVTASGWLFTGVYMVYLLAALQSVPKSLLEAASIDGASAFQCFRHVTLPSIRPVLSFVVLLSLVSGIQLFELPYVLLNYSAGPDNRGLTVVMYLYQTGFEGGDLGYATAIGWAISGVLVILAIAQQRLLRMHWRRVKL